MSTREEALEAALIELVACKDLKQQVDDANISAKNAQDYDFADELRAEYRRRQPLAWEAARAALAQPTDRTAEFLAGRDLTEGKYAQPVQPAPEPVAWVTAIEDWAPIVTDPNLVNSDLTLIPLYAAPLVQPAGEPPIAAAQKPEGASPGRSPVVPGGLITSDAAASEPAGDVRPAPSGYQPSKYVNWARLMHAVERRETALQRPAGEDRTDAERYHRLSAFADWDNEGGKGYWRIQFRSELSESLDDAIDALAETQRPAPKPDKPALSDGGTK